MKRTLLVAVLAAFALAACGKEEAKKPAQPPVVTTPPAQAPATPATDAAKAPAVDAAKAPAEAPKAEAPKTDASKDAAKK